MPLLERNGQISDDLWIAVGDDEDLPAQGDTIVSYGRLPLDAPGRLGISLSNDLDVGGLDLQVDGLSLIVLNFPSFADGRAYSQARALRQDLDYSGELRATGHLLPDQLGFMVEVGFDSFDLQTDRFPVERWTEALEAVTLTYHRHLSRTGQSPIIAARHAG
ncbi:MAG: DUF934 domain-containing protein [Alphaproteobacteria bacterium]|nr:DUF934 domain-containing protein [Alphaproteobacteria bacterium]